MQFQSGRKIDQILATIFFQSLLFVFVTCDMNPDMEDFILDDIKWGLTNDNKTDTCILLNGILQVLIPYPTDNYMMSDMTLLTVPRSANVSGTCGDPEQNMTLSWLPPSFDRNSIEGVSAVHSLTLTFIKRGESADESNDTFSEPYFELDAVSGSFYAGEDEFPGVNSETKQFTFEARNLAMLSVPVGLSYFCQASEVIHSDTKESKLVLSLLQVQAFHDGLSDASPLGVDYGPRSYCPKDGYRMILTVVGFVFFVSLLGALVFLIVNWRRPRRAGYWNL